MSDGPSSPKRQRRQPSGDSDSYSSDSDDDSDDESVLDGEDWEAEFKLWFETKDILLKVPVLAANGSTVLHTKGREMGKPKRVDESIVTWWGVRGFSSIMICIHLFLFSAMLNATPFGAALPRTTLPSWHHLCPVKGHSRQQGLPSASGEID